MTQKFFPARDPKKSINQSETEILKFWQENDIFQQSIDSRHPKRSFTFFDGPPFATGTPHYGHILAGTIKDTIPRYWTMKGYRVDRKFGWDCHGLPVEYQVEKEQEIGGKPGIEAMGVGKFNEICRSIVLRCRDEWEDTVSRMGRFVDFKSDYKTMDPEFMESVWSVFGQLWEKGLIYEGHKVVAYSPKLGSPLSNFEANLNYEDIDDPAVTIKFKLDLNDSKTADFLKTNYGETSRKFFVLAWTTTPWTLPSNCALGFGKYKDYVFAIEKESGDVMVISEEYYEKTKEGPIWERLLAGDGETAQDTTEYQIAGQTIVSGGTLVFGGEELVGLKYEPLFDFFDNDEDPKRFTIIHDDGDYVTTDSGTGIVHMAPFFGAEDDDLCKKFGINGVNPIDENGYFINEAPFDKGGLGGLYFRADEKVPGSTENNANIWVINTLKETGQLFKREQIRHSYPHCWRTDCALMYRGITTWFVNIQKIKDQMIAENKNINWIPDHLKEGRFGKMLESAPDWAISRNRYWGTPLPIWRCDSCDHIEVMASREQLEAKTGTKVPDLHKHFVDDLTWECPKCIEKNLSKGGKVSLEKGDTEGLMRRIEEVLDCWFESGSMPYASQHYMFDKDQPDFQSANFIAEGIDQTRGWFYTLHVLGVALWGKNIFQNVITNGLVLAEDGQKMSKSKKNYPDPSLVFEKYGADAMRFYLLKSPITKGENLRFAEHGVEEVLKSLILPLRNAYQFLSLYANIDGWSPTKLTFIRHGEAAHNVKSVYCGEAQNCQGLTETGLEQAHATAKNLQKFDTTFCSPMPRAHQTSDIIDPESQVDNRLTEVSFGNLEGQTWQPIQDRVDNPTTESLSDLQTRVEDFMTNISQTHAGENIGVVTHAGVIRAIQTGYLFQSQTAQEHLDFPALKTGGSQVIFPRPASDNELDRWIISELQTLIYQYRQAFDGYDLEHACRLLPVFVDKLNNWYLRRNRTRFWANGLSEDKQAGYQTLHYVLLNLSKLLAPICPFFAEELYQGLINEANRSVHLEFLPLPNHGLIDQSLQTKTELTREVVRLAASIRAKQKIKLRQPLPALQFALNADSIDLDLELIVAEANVKQVKILKNLDGIAQQIIKVDARLVGKKYGKKVQALIKAGKSGDFTLNPNGTVLIEGETLEPEEYEVGFLTEGALEAEATHQVVVLLDTEITPELEQEGLAREIIRSIQEARKSQGFEVSDYVKVVYKTEDLAALEALKIFSEMIKLETLCQDLQSSTGTEEIMITKA